MGPTDIGARVRAAIDGHDEAAMAALLHPDARWGAPGDPAPTCQNRAQVLAWYRRGWDAGVRATVTEVTVEGDKLLVGLRVTGNPAGADRWQVLTLADGLVVDIRGFDDRSEANAWILGEG